MCMSWVWNLDKMSSYVKRLLYYYQTTELQGIHFDLQIDTNRAVHIVSVIMLRRSDKRKDRVEISPEQLSFAASEAEISFVI